MAQAQWVTPTGDDWIELTSEPLPLGLATTWPVLPRSGALVVFAGTVRDHAEGRPGVVSLEYEAYAGAARRLMGEVAGELRQRWPESGRVVLWHRTGTLVPTEVSVVVAVSAPHRAEAFEAARFAIDALKSRVPIWKRETWEGGSDWALEACSLESTGVHVASTAMGV